jgi:hypothetical protein
VAHGFRKRSGLKFTIGTLVTVVMIGLGASWVSAAMVAAHDQRPNAHYPCFSKVFPYVHSCSTTSANAFAPLKVGTSHDPVQNAKDAVDRQWNRLDGEQRHLSQEWPTVVGVGAIVTIAFAGFVVAGRRRVSF